MNKRFSAIALVLALVVSIIVPFQAATPVSTVQWYGASDMAAADRDMVWYDNTTRTNASGNKITSNAHSADFGKMYFKWADKQSDDCYLKVEASVFETVEYFVLTAKSTNKYYDVKIQPAVGAKVTEDGCYVFYLPRIIEKSKNGKSDDYYVINMVFLDKVQYKDNPSVTVFKNWLDADGEPIVGTVPEVTFTNDYELGEPKLVEIGTQVMIEEDEIEGYELVGITINDEPVDAVDFKAVGNGVYTIFFTNQAVYVPVTKQGIIYVRKLIQQGEDIIPWNWEHEYFEDDNDYIFFDLYECDEEGDITSTVVIDTVQADAAEGLVAFPGPLDLDQWYLIVERFDFPTDHPRADKYEAINPIKTKAWAEDEDGSISFDPIEFDPETGIANKIDFILSNSRDDELKMYECLDTYDNYFGLRDASFFNLSDNVWACNTNIVPFWKSEMKKFSNYNNFFEELNKVWFTSTDDEKIYPEFVWNKDEFDDPYTALNGNTLIFEKTFTPYEELADEEIPLYVTADNAFFVFVNDKFVGASTSVKNPENLVLNENLLLTEDALEALIGKRLEFHIDAAGDISTWAKTYDFDIKDFILPGEENKITIIAVNEAGDFGVNGEPGVNDEATLFKNDPTINPGGIIFGCQIASYSEKLRFVNILPATASGMIVIGKFVVIDGEDTPWSDYFDKDDAEYIFFDLYDPEDPEYPDCEPIATAKINDVWGDIRFGIDADGQEVDNELEPGKTYIVKERFDDEIEGKYAPRELEVVAIGYDEEQGDDGYEIINELVEPQHHVLISNPDDVDLRSSNGDVVNVNNASTYWKRAEDLYNDSFTRYDTNDLFSTMKAIKLDVNGIGYNAEYVWNTDDFSNVDLAQNGDIVKFEKKFTDVGEIVGDENGDVNLYIAADNAYLLFVNDKFVGQSGTISEMYSSAMYEDTEIRRVVGDLSDNFIDCQNYDVLDTFNIIDFLESNADENTITIIVINESADEEGQHTHHSDGWNVVGYKEYEDWAEFPDKNPAAAIFACEFWSK